jgi:hypothetical protein
MQRRASSARCSRRSWVSRHCREPHGRQRRRRALAIAGAPADGYTIGIITVEIGMMHWQGLTDLTGGRRSRRWRSSTPIPQACRSQRMRRTSRSTSLLAAIKANPGKMKASAPGRAASGISPSPAWLKDLNVDPASVPWVPSNGAAPGLQDLVAGGVQIAPVSLPEARSLIDAGKVKSLAVMSPLPRRSIPTSRPSRPPTGSNWAMAAWRGMAAPKNLPPEARDKLVAALRKIVASKEYTDFMTQRGFGVIYAPPEEFATFMAKSDTDLGATMKAVGIVK